MACSWTSDSSCNYCTAIGVVSISILYVLWKYFQGGQYRKDYVRIDGKVVIVTGCNTGIGKETVLDLAKRGAKIYMACRDYNRCEEARTEIINKTGNSNIFNRELNLDSLESVRKFAEKFRKEESHLDILVNNAGLMLNDRKLTKDGFEMTFGVNHLGHFLLTNLLLDLLKASSSGRIINVSSLVHFYGKINKDDLQAKQSYNGSKAYHNSKLANVLFTRELDKRLRGTKVKVNSLHPGVVATDFLRNQSKLVLFFVNFVLRIFLKTSRSGAQTQIALAVDPDLGKISGKYFADCKVKEEAKAAQDEEMATWLWNHSEKLTGLSK